MKAVLISIKPKYCALIASGKKTVEVRKTRPKLGTPFKCYIYETRGFERVGNDNLNCVVGGNGRGKVIGEFVCDTIEHFDSAFDEWARSVAPGGSIINSMGWDKFLEVVEKKARITLEELEKYFPDDVRAYLWHISALKIYDKPREMREFWRWCNGKESETDPQCVSCAHLLIDNDGPAEYHRYCETSGRKKINRPPQSWCYVEQIEQEEN